MPRANAAEEVEVLRFFEEAPIEKAEMLFNIVKEKMRGRLAGSGQPEPKKKRHTAPKESGERRSEEDGESSPQI
jgi:hypothetical protein